ncbi:MAG: glycosyltransferase family 4 protein [Bacteroidota bacterium]
MANSTWNLVHYRRPWIEGLMGEGFTVYTASPVDKHLADLEQLTGTTHFALHYLDPKGQRSRSELACWWELLQLYRRLKPQLVAHFTIKPNIYGGIAARCLGIRYLGVITGLGYTFIHGGWRNGLVPYLYRLGLARAKAVVFYNSADRQVFLEKKILSSQACRMIDGSGVNIDHFHPKPIPPLTEKGLKLIFVGRLLRDKGVLELIQAVAILRSEGVKVQLSLLGAAETQNPEALHRKEILDYIDASLEQAASHRLDQVKLNTPAQEVPMLPSLHALMDEHQADAPPIRLCDPVKDVRPSLLSHHLFVLPSYREGLTRAGVEALSTGRPVLLSDVPGCRELIIADGVNGHLVPPKAVGPLVRQLRDFSSYTHNKLTEMGAQSRQLAEERFSAKATTTAFLQLVRDSLR